MPNRVIVSPPRAKKLLEANKEKTLPYMNIEVHTGLEDEICDPNLAKEIFGDFKSCHLVLVANDSHRLNKDYIKDVLTKFLS